MSMKKYFIHFLHNNIRWPKADKRGFTLLLSALVASIVLALGTSVFGIAQKELMLSSIGRDSQFAFYAADTAAECALYWDARHNYFATTTPPIDPTCDDEDLVTSGHSTSYPYTILFQIEPNGYCADVTVSKSRTGNPVTGPIRTVVHADGFSTTCAAVATNPRTLQRSVEISY